ncbi:hypothetical protein CI102_2955 [Trichoderma harzianum]|nr:hypothetical protein CI102_2955 [Trichoderma harzianum]
MITADGPSVAGDRRAKKQRDCLALTNGGVGDGDDSDGDAEIVIVPGRACCARGRRLAERVEVESERKRRKKEVWRFQGAGWQSTSTSGGTCTSPVQAARFFYRLPVATVQPAWRAPGRSGPSAAVTSDGGATGDGLMDGIKSSSVQVLFRIWLFTVPSPCFSRHNTQSVPVLRKGNSSAALARRNPWPHGVTGALRPTGQQMAASGQRARGLLDAKGPLEAARGRGLDNWSRRQATVGWGLLRLLKRRICPSSSNRTFRYQAVNWHYQVQQPLLPRFSKTEPRYGKQWVMALNFRKSPTSNAE